MAAIKLDQETFDHLVGLGTDPLLPDSEGNTWIHTLALGTITDKEYDFIKRNVLKYALRLTRNKENRTALNTIKQFSGQALGLRGQPNFKRKIWEWFELRLQQDRTFIDAAEDTPMQTKIKQLDLQGVENCITHQTVTMKG